MDFKTKIKIKYYLKLSSLKLFGKLPCVIKPGMKKVGTAVLVLLAIALIVGGAFFFIGYFRPKSAGILVETNPPSLVFINDVQVGRTPYETTIKAEEIVLKLVPESFEKPLAPFETKVNLAPGIRTVVKRDFGESEETSSGVIVSYEKEGGNNASIAVVSVPDSAQISVDGQVKGFTPYKMASVTPGEHVLEISSPSYLSQDITVRAQEGYKLTAFFNLAPDPNYEEEKKEEEEEAPEESQVQVFIKILSTPNNFLRVRGKPSTTSEEIGRVNSGEKYLYIETDEQSGWFRIEYEEGEQGWVSDEYAEMIEEEEEGESEETSSPSPSPSVDEE